MDFLHVQPIHSSASTDGGLTDDYCLVVLSGMQWHVLLVMHAGEHASWFATAYMYSFGDTIKVPLAVTGSVIQHQLCDVRRLAGV